MLACERVCLFMSVYPLTNGYEKSLPPLLTIPGKFTKMNILVNGNSPPTKNLLTINNINIFRKGGMYSDK